MVAYLINSIVCMTLLWGFYAVFLAKTKEYQFNRFYLLGALILSLIIPSLEFSLENEILNLSSYTSSFTISNSLLTTLLSLYTLGVILLSIKFLVTLYILYRKIQKNTKAYTSKGTIVFLEEKVLPHTFLKYVFVNANDYHEGKIEEELFTHEYMHVRERHTLDILFIELFQIIFWFNPSIFLIKKAVRLNHEYIADSKVVDTHKDPISYQEILLNIATWNHKNSLVSNVNYSITKKRFVMMKDYHQQTNNLLLKLIIIPLVFILLFLFANITLGEEHHDGREHSSFASHKTTYHL